MNCTLFIEKLKKMFVNNFQMRWIKNEGYGGAFLWTLDYDDFSNCYGEGKYPLLQAINDEL